MFRLLLRLFMANTVGKTSWENLHENSTLKSHESRNKASTMSEFARRGKSASEIVMIDGIRDLINFREAPIVWGSDVMFDEICFRLLAFSSQLNSRRRGTCAISRNVIFRICEKRLNEVITRVSVAGLFVLCRGRTKRKAS